MAISKRQVEISVADGFEATAGGVLEKHVADAIGYLSIWSIGGGNYPRVELFLSPDGNMLARYWHVERQRPYEIHAQLDATVPSKRHYTFHS